MIARLAVLALLVTSAGAAAWLIPRMVRPVEPFGLALHLIEAGRAEEAVHLLKSPGWQGIAEYRAGRLRRALAAFAQDSSVTGFYNFGTTHARLHQWDAAEEALQTVLAVDPGHDDARHNLMLVQKARAAERELREDTQQAAGDGPARDPDTGSSGTEPEPPDSLETGAAEGGGGDAPAETPAGLPGESQGGGLAGTRQVTEGEAGRAAGPGSGRAPENMVGASGGRAMDRTSGADLDLLLGRISDDPRRVLAARLRAAHQASQ